MHGIIHLELQRFAETRHGATAWRDIVSAAGVPQRFAYVRLGQYPDSELTAVVEVLALRAGVSTETILQQFGTFIVPTLLTMFPKFVPTDWRALDLIVNAEALMHRVVRARDPGARPPHLRCERVERNEVVVTYRSQRRLCSFGRGIIEGIAHHYDEPLDLTETSCMLRGHAACRFVVRLSGA